MAARLTSTHARDSRPRTDRFTGARMITGKCRRKKGLARIIVTHDPTSLNPVHPERPRPGTRPRAGPRPARPLSLGRRADSRRSEEHTSELQSHVNLVCRLLLE